MLRTRSEQRCFGGTQGCYELDSPVTGGPMRFTVFLPPAERPPVLYYLAGLTCTEETFPAKAGAQRVAAELGLALVACDTSPRHARYEGDAADWDFGQGAGFYLDATRAPWAESYRMETHVVAELRAAVEASFPVASDRRGIIGHSMGGHGALTLALRHPAVYQSVSALAPIVAPSVVPWGEKAFAGYLADRSEWAAHDTCELIRAGRTWASAPLVDQGLADKFLARELRPELLEAACAEAGASVTVRRHAGYDHSYYFIATVIEDHLRHHAAALR
ncbi:MAG: S-formylglutathione hydrolase [Deltaproteobacteria bacterium]|nr:S-formylglutathione hydrolase [Deltaproteobacteria bacterium]